MQNRQHRELCKLCPNRLGDLICTTREGDASCSVCASEIKYVYDCPVTVRNNDKPLAAISNKLRYTPKRLKGDTVESAQANDMPIIYKYGPESLPH